MKTSIFVSLVLLLFAFSSCNQENVIEPTSIESNAVLYNYDMGMCPCCGGYIISIEEDGEAYRFEKLPEGSSIELPNENLAVKITYDLDFDCNGIKYIIINTIEEL